MYDAYEKRKTWATFPLHIRNAVVFDCAVINMRVKTVEAFVGHQNSLITQPYLVETYHPTTRKLLESTSLEGCSKETLQNAEQCTLRCPRLCNETSD